MTTILVVTYILYYPLNKSTYLNFNSFIQYVLTINIIVTIVISSLTTNHLTEKIKGDTMKKPATHPSYFFEINTSFWRRNKPQVLGDFIGRPEAIALLNSTANKKILDAGCGTGYVSRILALKGGIVFGCDADLESIKVAKRAEATNPLGISYRECDIRELPFDSEFFNYIVSISVLVYITRVEIWSFLQEAYRVLKKNGEIIISIPHPYMQSIESPARKEVFNWIKYCPLKIFDKESQKFKQLYFNTEMEMFSAEVWSHPISFYIESLKQHNFAISHIKELFIRKKHLIRKEWGSQYDYPGYFLIKATKKQ
ncbi:MAG: hypothetical protein ACD_11C00117G0006 [uncultured bacterium]|nr:MAG: hypothetical protein ACD_11C00117G0006 [uncultured bacterium]HBR71589.1 hypothetical protein [Candidatus Moranbacteria bacterium]